MNSEHDERLERHQVVLDDDKKHNLNCRRREEVGNWPSKQLLQNNKQLKRQEEELSNFLKKRENGELLIQKTARLYENFLAPVQQQPMVEKTFIVFDQTIQLIACDMPEIVPGKGLLTLSVIVNEPHINRCQEIDQHCELSCAPSTDLIARNAFVIRRVQPQLQCSDVSNVEYLKYGEDFLLECYSSCKQPLLVYSMPKNPFASSQCDNVVFKAHEKEPHRHKGYKHVFHDEYRKYLDAHPSKNHHEWSEERKFRREQRFNQTLEWIKNHKKNHHPYDVGVTRFADVLEEDLPKYHGLDESQNRHQRALPVINPLTSPPPASLDYTSWAPPITDQGKCGSCWAFSTIGMLSTVYRYTSNKVWNYSLSEQYLVDCDAFDNGCNGGWPKNTLLWLKNQSSLIPDSASYPYTSGTTANRTACKVTGLNKIPLKLTNIYQWNVNGNETLTKQILYSYGPVVTTMSVPLNCTAFYSYKSGVYVDNCNCVSNCTLVNHGVVLMGYGTENGLNYWLFRNSWGTTWGNNGYMKIARSSLNKCNMACFLMGIEQ